MCVREAAADSVTVDTYLIEVEERDVTTTGRRCNGSSGDRNQHFSLSLSLSLSISAIFLTSLSVFLLASLLRPAMCGARSIESGCIGHPAATLTLIYSRDIRARFSASFC